MALPPLIPLEVLLGNPSKVAPQLSPSGRQLSYLAPREGVMNLWIRDLSTCRDRPVTADIDRGIQHYFWSYSGDEILFLQDVGGNENWKLRSVSTEDLETRDLAAFEGVQTQILSYTHHRPDHVLLGLNKDNPHLHDVYELDLRDGKLTKVVSNPGFMTFIADDSLRVRAALAPKPDGSLDLFVKASEEGDWRLAVAWDADDAATSTPISFSGPTSIYLLDSRGADTARLVEMDLTTNSVSVIAANPEFDVTGVSIDPMTREVEAASFTSSRREWVVISDSVRADYDAISKINPGDFHVASRSQDNKKWLIAFTNAESPVSYWLYDRHEKEADFLFSHQPALEDFVLAPMEPFTTRARDGLNLHGYLTFPVGAERKRLPVVVLVHGGPWARDVWGFDPTVQWLANRGYLVVQVNFRGSTGYGKAFVNKGDREWGAAMQNDLMDALEWVVANDLGDPDRICVFGGSYGGYAALIGATEYPDFFRCIVDICGPTDLTSLLKGLPPHWGPALAMFYRRMGHPEADRDLLLERSPLSKAHKIRSPILIGQGANDPRVPKQEALQLVETLLQNNIPHRYIEFPDEGHGFAREANRLEFLRVADVFLAEHLGGRAESHQRPAVSVEKTLTLHE